MAADRDAESAEAVLETIRSRRVTRAFDERPVVDEALLRVLEAGRWATSGGGRRIHPWLVVRDPRTIARLRAVTPGMFSSPPVVIVICTDAERAAAELVQLEHDRTTWIDIGTAAMNMMVAAHALGLGSCPVTSFSHGAAGVVLGLPSTVEPELFLLLGHRRTPARPTGTSGTARKEPPALPAGLVWWEHPGRTTSGAERVAGASSGDSAGEVPARNRGDSTP
jgi:albonoursin synthase